MSLGGATGQAILILQGWTNNNKLVAARKTDQMIQSHPYELSSTFSS